MTQDARPTLFEPDPALEIPETVSVVDIEVAEPVAEVAAHVDEPARRVNPWVVALWVAAVVLIVSSAVAYAATLESQFNGFSYYGESQGLPLDYMIGSAIANFAPGVFAVGLASGVAAASISAAQWMRRHP
jgi:hypothetical protein